MSRSKALLSLSSSSSRRRRRLESDEESEEEEEEEEKEANDDDEREEEETEEEEEKKGWHRRPRSRFQPRPNTYSPSVGRRVCKTFPPPWRLSSP